MKKRICIIVWSLFLLVITTGFGVKASYTDKSVPVAREGVDDGELTLRFYDETPNVAYIGLCYYIDYMRGEKLTKTDTSDDTCTITNKAGGEIICDVKSGTLTFPDWNLFHTPDMPIEECKSLKDSKCQFVRISEIIYEGTPEPVNLDFAKYGIQIYKDDQDVYLPLALMSNIMTDIATYSLHYNGESLSAERVDLGNGENTNHSTFNTTSFGELFSGKERPADLVKECYADLCFTFDNLFGYPGIAKLDSKMKEKGLDKALDDYKDGPALKAKLLSTSEKEYLEGLAELFGPAISDGHTVSLDLAYGLPSKLNEANPDAYSELNFSYIKYTLQQKGIDNAITLLYVTAQRNPLFGDDWYIEYGNTAIIRLESFLPDEDAWDMYYNGNGKIPEDDIGKLVTSLKKASENPQIKNIIFDLSINSGGSSDVLAAILGLTTGNAKLRGYQELTHQKMTVCYDVDTNFDGIFDEADKETHYDFNYGVLTTRQAFSCGNLFPFVMQEAGAVLIGEPTGGGSCCVQVGQDSEGFRFMMSSAQWHLLDEYGESVEVGCHTDIPLSSTGYLTGSTPFSFIDIPISYPIYAHYFNAKNLDRLMNDWYAEEHEPAA